MTEHIFKVVEQIRLINEHKTQKEIRYLQVLWCKSKDDEYYMAWMAKGQVLMSLDETEESQHCFEKAYSLNPRYAWKALADFFTGENLEHASGMSAKGK